MNTITRLFIAPLLVLCLAVLGCAVFPGQHQDTTSPKQKETAATNIVLPANDQSSGVQPDPSSDQSVDAVFRGLPPLTSETFDARLATEQNRLRNSTVTPQQYQPENSRLATQNQSLVPKELYSNRATIKPTPNEKVFQANRIEFAADKVPFGNGLQTTSHSAVEPIATPSPVDDAVKDATMSISDVVPSPPEAGTISWPIDDFSPTPIPIRSNSIRLNFLVPDPVNEEAAKKLKLLIDVDGKYFNRDAESKDLSDKAQVTTFKFSGTWDATDTILVTVDAAPGQPIPSGSDKITSIIDSLVIELNKLNASGDIVWSRDKEDKELLVANAKFVGKPFDYSIVPTKVGASSAPKIVRNTVTTAQGDKETNDMFEPGLNPVTLSGLPEGKTVEIKVWIEKQITEDTPNDQTTFRSFKVTTPTRDPEAPVITKVANTEYVTPGDVPALLKLFYDKPFIRLEGTHGTSERGELTFILRDAAGEPVSAKIENLKVDPINEAQRTWKAEFNLSEKLEGDGRLFVLRKQGNKHNYSPTPLKFQTIEPTGAALSDTISIKVNKPGGAAAELKDNEVFLTNQTEVVLSGPKSGQPIPAEFAIVATTKGGKTYLNSTQGAGDGAWDFSVKGLKEGRQDIVVDLMLGQKFQGVSTTIPIFVRTEGPRIISVEPSNFGTAPGVSAMTIKFDPNNPLSADTWDLFKDKTGLETVFSIYGSNGTGVFTGAQSPVPSPLSTTSTVTLNKPGHAITLMFNRASLPADIYQLQVKGELIEDVYGNLLVGDDGEKGTLYTKILGGDGISASGGLASKFKADDTPTINPAIGDSTGEFVAYPEFVRRPDVPDGFNPNDKVETRVVRLYYYRDAHRIAQIVNRKVQSYNRAAVKTNRQLADKARNQANQLTVQRQNSERNAIILAGKTRQQENELQQAENSLNGSLQQLTNYRREKGNVDLSDDAMNKQLESLVNSFGRQVTELRGRVQESRDQEVQANELTQQAEAQEKLAREDQFRREVAAAHSDPDTYAPGKINSVDPVEQVSVSVVGEGMIQLRGPLKGINLIRTAIDQLDSPVGQVRISLHTIQINGERADRMEVVAKEVQTYIDHARFLTMQSSEMLRKAVVQVASQKAEEASGLYPGSTQMDRDERYIVAFFGKDFIDELKAMDSEFLHTGNKLLSLHSMDTTSLASALNLMALAKNSTRQDIFATFDSMLQTQLPQAEQNYFAAGWTCPKKKKHNLFHRCKDCQPEFCPMACNARFESLRGFFDMQISNDDTMTPLQREFIRLAQIFKSRLVTEMEYKQRVMERALIEERLGNRKVELQAAIDKEDAANEELEKMQEATVKGRVNMIRLIKEIEHGVQFGVESEFTGATGRSSFFKKMASLKEPEGTDSATWNNRTIDFKLEEKRNYYTFDDQESVDFVKREYDALLENMRYIHSVLQLLATIQGETKFKDDLDDLNEYILDMETDGLRQRSATQFSVGQLDVQFIVTVDELLAKMSDPFTGARNVLLNGLSDLLSKKLTEMLSNLSSEKSADIDRAYASWLSLKKLIRPLLQTIRDPVVKTELNTKVNSVEKGFSDLFGNGFLLARAESQATKSRRPLDHKKFLDMLVDDLEEKYIELLDGTRAHVANIDNYLKRVTTALDDDFNTQFYYPAFKYIRESSVSYDVQFGQFETTTLLANNREFAKADPSASMEFDLPERDILIAEGLNGAKAMMSDIGALANDPTFLAMTKLNGPGSTASFNRGASGGNGVVRNVLPGLGSNTSEQVMSQNSNGGQQFGSNLENLIPDPAVYKFETGTGFEIRPVIQPDGQAVVFDFNYMYTTEIREPVRADEKHLGRVKRHFVDTDVQLSNFELREVSRYTVALKAARTAKGVPLFEDIPGVGVLFRPLPSDENSLQQNLIMAQATIFPTLFDLMGLRWASVVSDLDPLTLSTSDFVVRNRHRMLENRVYDESSSYVDEFLRVPESERRMDLYRSQESVPYVHPNGYAGPGMNVRDSQMQEGYQPNRVYPAQPFVPHQSIEGSPNRSQRRPSDEWYYQNRSSAPPNPNGIREPGAVNPERGR